MTRGGSGMALPESAMGTSRSTISQGITICCGILVFLPHAVTH